MVNGSTGLTFAGWMSEFPEEIPGSLTSVIGSLGDDNGFGEILTFTRIYQIPEGTKQGDKIDPKEWIQTAGTASRLTVEVKRREADGSYRQYTVGRPNAAGEPAESELILIGDKNELSVRPSEVLTAQDAIGIFQHYYDHHSIPEGWHLRELSEYTDTSEQNGAAMPVSVSDDSQHTSGAVAGQADNTAVAKSAQTEAQDRQRVGGAQA